MPAAVADIAAIEHRGDEMTHRILIKLNQTFITPFDREDIHLLASSLDDVLDFIFAASDRLRDLQDHAALAFGQGARRHHPETGRGAGQGGRLARQGRLHLLDHCVEVNRLENEADKVSREAIGRLFDGEHDPITLIKLKELLEVLEEASDKAEDVADVLETVVLKSA